MSNHCPKCGTCHEEDDGRVCAACTTWDALAEKRARQDAEIESLRKSNQMFVQAIESWKKLHRAAVGALAKKMEENAALAERVKGAVSDEWRVRYYQLRGCIRTDPMMDGTNRILGVNIPLLNEIIENHRNNPVEEARDAK